MPAVDPSLTRPATRSVLSAEHLLRPPRQDRPAIRWWWQSPVPTSELLEELDAIKEAGFGEVEIAFSPEFWGDVAQREALEAVLEHARLIDVGVSMTLGAAWPLQTPATGRGTPHAARELQYGVAWVDGDGGRRVTPVPAPFDDPERARPARLVAVVAARVVERGSGPRTVPSGNPWGAPTTIAPPLRPTLLDQDHLQVMTSAVRGQGVSAVVSWMPGAGQWALVAVWERDSEQGVTSFLDAAAARAALQDIDEYQIGHARAGLAAEGSTATELFEDSLELNADCLFWTPGMLARFTEHAGYDPTAYLPLMMAHGQCRYWVPQEPVVPDFESATTDGTVTDLGARVRADYDRLLTELYVREHLRVLQDWAAGHGMRYKAQAAYGQNLEPVRSFRELVRCGGRAEVESLNSGDRVPVSMNCPTWRFSVDWQRSCVSGAQQAGAARVSTELGAQMDRCYDFGLSDYRQMLDKEWAVGVTKPFVHGFASQSSDAPWPTQGRFGTIVSESWNHRSFPQWSCWPALADYWARGTAVLETGVARADVAVYRDGFLTTAARGDAAADATAPDRLIDAEAMERNGLVVGLIDPVGLAEADLGQDEAGFQVLLPQGPAYRALAVGEESLTVPAAQAMARAARRGLPIVVVGPAPRRDRQWGGRDRSAEVAHALAQVLACQTTVQVPRWDEVPDALTRLGVRGRARWGGPLLLSQVREADEGRYVLVYNPADSKVVTEIDIEGRADVEVIDLDRGQARPVACTLTQDSTRVAAALAPRGLVVLRRLRGLRSDRGGILPQVRVAGAVVGPQVCGQDLEAQEAEELTLVWEGLEVRSSEPGGSRRVELEGQGPADWRSLPELAQVSGTGVYTAVVRTVDGREPRREQLLGIGLCLGEVGGVAQVSVGDSRLAAVTRPDDVVPVGQALAAEVGARRPARVEVRVRTTLRNAALAADLYEPGPWEVEHPSVPHGLLGPVRLVRC